MWGVIRNYYIGQHGRPPEYMLNPKMFNNLYNQPIVKAKSSRQIAGNKVSMSGSLSFKEWPPDVMEKINQINYII
tara:strand:- start:2700 stop:2924 length:225 start_codon:yes stop_codon:yes gene_type:complete